MKRLHLFTEVRAALANRDEPENIRILAVFYWRALLCIAAAIFVLCVIWGFMQLRQVLATIDTLSETAAQSKAPFNRKDIDDIAATLAKRQDRYMHTKAMPRAMPDPSR